MTRVAVIGAAGRMGRGVLRAVLEAPDLRLVAAVDAGDAVGSDAAGLVGLRPAGVLVTPVTVDAFGQADVAIDFSTPRALADCLDVLGTTALVTGTTGLDEDAERQLERRAALGAVLAAANFSTGVTLLLDLVGRAAAALPDFDVEIVEAHHRRKVDAPSGTALALGRAAAAARGVSLDAHAVHGRSGQPGPRPPGDIGFHAVRGGDVVGEHRVWLAGEGERVELGHVASSRQTFVEGAVRAARWLAGRPPGRYSLRDVLGLTQP